MIERNIFSEEHEMWRESVRKFVEKEIVPHHERWEKEGIVPRELWLKAGEAGMLCCTVPEEYGGLGLDYLFDAVVYAELWRGGGSGPGRPVPSVPNRREAWGDRRGEEPLYMVGRRYMKKQKKP